MTRLIYSENWPRIANLLVVVVLIGYILSVVVVAQWLDVFADPFMRYASAFVIVQFGVLGSIGLLLIAGKFLRVRWESRRASRIRQLEELVAAPDSGDETRKAARRWPEEFLTVVNYTLQSIRGSARERVIRLLEASALYPSLLQQTLSRNPDRAIRAITLLGQLETPQARAAVNRALEHPAETIRQAARKVIMQGSDPEAQQRLFETFPQLPAWQRLVLYHFAPPEAVLLPQFVAKALHSVNETRILIALELVLTRQRFLPCALPISLARAANPEIRIKFFKALRFLRLENDLVKALQLGLGDSDWRVRAMAAQACGQFRTANLAERLLAMCRKFENPAEAAHAARALAALGGEGWLRLQQVANSETDIARQIATETVERHMLGGAA
jgi:HEAT repeat protein